MRIEKLTLETKLTDSELTELIPELFEGYQYRLGFVYDQEKNKVKGVKMGSYFEPITLNDIFEYHAQYNEIKGAKHLYSKYTENVQNE